MAAAAAAAAVMMPAGRKTSRKSERKMSPPVPVVGAVRWKTISSIVSPAQTLSAHSCANRTRRPRQKRTMETIVINRPGILTAFSVFPADAAAAVLSGTADIPDDNESE